MAVNEIAQGKYNRGRQEHVGRSFKIYTSILKVGRGRRANKMYKKALSWRDSRETRKEIIERPR